MKKLLLFLIIPFLSFGQIVPEEGCMDDTACNYVSDANVADNSLCEYPGDSCFNWNWEDVLMSSAGTYDSMCECVAYGCTNENACNYNYAATEDDGSCTYPELYYDCEGNCMSDADEDTVCDEVDNCPEIYNTSQYDSDGDGVGELCEINGCDDSVACNYNNSVTENDGSCEYDSCAGCLDVSACNYNSLWTISNQDSCTYPELYYDCESNCLSDTDTDGVCDELDNCPYDYNPNQEIVCDVTSIKEINNSKILIKAIDILGRKTNKNKGLQLHIYDDGSVEKKYLIK